MMLEKAYKKRFVKRLFLTLFLMVSIIGLLWLSLISGSNGVRFEDTFRMFTCNDHLSMIVQSIRLPRALAALLVGMLLGLSGVVMQGVLRNPLASPFTLGISQAAGFGATLAIIFFGTITPLINNLNYVIILDGKNRRKKIITKRVV